jgi:hypothetical protein
MSSAHYSVIRYIADPARGEPYNIGVIVWNENGYAFDVDDAAIARITRDNPHLERDALMYVTSYIHQRLTQTVPPFTRDGLLRVVAEQSGFPIEFSDARYTMTGDKVPEPLVAETERLIARIVRPARRRGGPMGLRTTAALARELQPLIKQERIAKNFSVRAPRTGVHRTVDFYANSGANIALDVLNLSLARADDIRARADQEAFKVWDILDGELVNDYYVLGVVPSDRQLAEVTATAARVIRSTGGRFTANVDEAREILEAAAAARARQLFDTLEPEG